MDKVLFEHDVIEQFIKTWTYTRKVSDDFLQAIPEDKWTFSHSSKYSTFAKQFRHVTCVYGVYIEGFLNQKVDFGKKHSHYSGPLEKAAIQENLRLKDRQFIQAMNVLKEKGIGSFKLDFFGVNMTFTEYTHILVQHECLHMGIWSTMADAAGFEVPKSWKSDWGFN